MSYTFLLIAADDASGEEMSAKLKDRFPNSRLDVTSIPQDGVDFCRANVYDLIFAEANHRAMSIDQMRAQINEMENDNFNTGILALGDPAKPIQDLSHTMLLPQALDDEGFLGKVKCLLALKN